MRWQAGFWGARGKPRATEVTETRQSTARHRGRHGPKARATALGLALWAVPAMGADDFIVTDGPLSDEDFYRLVACAASPGEACTKDIVRWRIDRPLRVSLARVDTALLGGKKKRAEASITRAVQYLNEADFGLTLEAVPRNIPADIRVYLIDTDGETPIIDSGIDWMEGLTVSGARVLVWADRDSGTIARAAVVFGTKMPIEQYESAMIEEITQAMGLLTDIRNPEYEGVSVFSQDSNAAKRLGPQDIIALRRHYQEN